jgi:hypothetical protein
MYRYATLAIVALLACALPCRAADIGDFVWLDLDEDGIQDAGEPGLAGVTVELWEAAGGSPYSSDVTDANGIYAFSSVPVGDYHLQVSLPVGYSGFSPQDAGGDDTRDSDVDSSGLVTLTVTVADDYVWDAGIVPEPASAGAVLLGACGLLLRRKR